MYGVKIDSNPFNYNMYKAILESIIIIYTVITLHKKFESEKSIKEQPKEEPQQPQLLSLQDHQ